MKTFCLILALLALVGTSESHLFAQEKAEPQFNDFPVSVWSGKVAAPNLKSHPMARKFRTMLREQVKDEGINFAGHYTLASAGCGTGCSITGIVDARTGSVYFPREFFGWTIIVGDYDFPDGEDQRMFRPDSKMLRAVGRPRIGGANEERYGPSGIYYYEWARNRLRLVKFTPVGSYPKADPPERS